MTGLRNYILSQYMLQPFKKMQCYFSKSHQQLINSVVVFLLNIFSFFLIPVVIFFLETVRNTTIQIILLQIIVQYKYMLLYICYDTENYDIKQSSQLETHNIIHIKHETRVIQLSPCPGAQYTMCWWTPNCRLNCSI